VKPTRLAPCSLIAILSVLVSSSHAQAWNALGHKVVCEIAWQQIDQPTRDNIVATPRPGLRESYALLRPLTL